MQSDQEAVIEEFIRKSFGAQFLYIPKKYAKGTAHREPADLAWLAGDTVTLFYLRSSKEKLADQIKHNRIQAAGYYRAWSSDKPAYALRGKNVYGDECYVPHKTVKKYLSILIVSEKCGIQFSHALTDKIDNAVIVIPEMLMHWVAEFGGTIVDLLILIEAGLSDNVGKQNRPDEEAFQALAMISASYVSHSLSLADPEKRYLTGSISADYSFLKERLSKNRLTGERSIGTTKGREQLAGIFGDLTLADYSNLAATAEKAIALSEPPLFNKWAVVKVKGPHYSFVIATFNLGSTNVEHVNQVAIDASRDEQGIVTAISILYGNIMGANEYREPFLIDIPPKLPQKHYDVVINKIIALNKQRTMETV
jgi:hypothetical protein